MIQQHINDLKLVDQTLDEDDYKSDGETRQRIDRVIDYLQNSVNTNVLRSLPPIVKQLKRQIKECDSEPNEVSWGMQEGILISKKDAETIIQLLAAMT